MKKIFVTVKEFRENGGRLEKGRTVYNEFELDEEDSGVYECEYGKSSIICYFGGVVDELHEECAYVQIDCTPIYK